MAEASGRSRGRGRGRGRRRGNDDDFEVQVMPKEVFVRQLPESYTDEQVLADFGAFGTLEKHQLASRSGRVTLSVGYTTEEAAAAALAGMHDKEIDGKTIIVEQLRTRQRKGVVQDPLKIWVGGLDDTIPEDDIMGLFAGEVTEFELANNKSFANFTFANLAEAQAALEKDGTQFGGLTIKVQVQRGRAPAAPRAPRRTANPLEAFVGHLPEDATAESVMPLFAGAVSAQIADGHGYVTFDTEENATAAIAMNATEVIPGAEVLRIEPSRRGRR